MDDCETTTMSNGNSATWIDDGEKYAVVGLTVKVDGHIREGSHLTSGCWQTRRSIPLRIGESGSAVFAPGRLKIAICSCSASWLRRRLAFWTLKTRSCNNGLGTFYVGLLLASTFAPAHKPVMLTGSRRVGEIDIRQQQDFDSPIPCLFRPYPPAVSEDIRLD